VIIIVKRETQLIMTNLESVVEVDDELNVLMKMVNALERLQLHFEFTLQIIQSQSEEEIIRHKQKFSEISKAYELIKKAEDVALIPLKHLLIILHDKLIVKLRELIKDCFRGEHYADIEFIKSIDNISKIKIITVKCELTDLHFPIVAGYPKDDIFCQPTSSILWQDLYKSATFKNTASRTEIQNSLKQLHVGLRMANIMFKRLSEFDNNSKLKSVVNVAKDLVYYGVQQSKAETQTLVNLLKPTMEEAFKTWNLTENPILSKFLLLVTPVIAFDEVIYVPRLFPQLTKEKILMEYQDGSLNKLSPLSDAELAVPQAEAERYNNLEELFKQSETKIPIRILAHEHLTLKQEKPSLVRSTINRIVDANPWSENKPGIEGAIVVHIHGGGFVSMSSATHRVYTNRWVKDLKAIHFSIDYRLAPKNMYPDALDDVWQAYLWIVNYAETVLGIKKQKIIITGDSAGGNLAVALMLRLAKAGLPTPHGCLLMYPCLAVDGLSSSPSYLSSIEDPMLPTSLLKMVAKAYVGEEFDCKKDPFISPIAASDDLLQKNASYQNCCRN